MALLRILVDGYSLLHAWPNLAPGHPPFSATARESLIAMLARYNDACGTPVTVVFDGRNLRETTPDSASRHIEVLFSRAGQTADQIIERVAHRMKPFGEVMVVTDDHAERDIVVGFGALAVSCHSFIASIESAVADLTGDLARYNSIEKRRYKQS
jgi:predicted RNA-binding protein with PIN domain